MVPISASSIQTRMRANYRRFLSFLSEGVGIDRPTLWTPGEENVAFEIGILWILLTLPITEGCMDLRDHSISKYLRTSRISHNPINVNPGRMKFKYCKL
jgi:hypothetical protein